MKTLWAWLVELDRILRGETTRMADLQDGRLRFPLFGVLFVLIVLAYAEGDRRSLRNLLSRDVFDGFDHAIRERETKGETAETRFVSIDRSDVTAAEVRGSTAHVTVRFVSQLVSVTRDSRSRTIYVKLVNAGAAAVPVQLDIAGASLRPAGTAVTLAGDPQDTNAIDAPNRVAPKTSQVTGVKSGFTYTVPANGIVVLELGTR